ncbi:MAG: hypothetical protein M3071_03800 [Actinomycetota bacterium]|nr:hypothetical protein [Actinomycetota bacterium]
MTEEPALGFWLRYAESEGALVEDRGDHAVVVLTDPLQEESELPEEVTVTSRPDVAREDAAVLLIAGHPAVERAAAVVLADGDTGSSYLPWPASRSPARSTLEARARELVSIEHARIDAAGEPIAAYLPLLRVGAMVSYEASLTLRFQEQEEAWIEARTGLEPSSRLQAALPDGRPLPRPDGRVRTLEADLPRAISAAHERLEGRAREREAALGRHARRALDAELTRADAYYDAALESIARRRASAPADRARLLDGQAESTRAERARRRREIQDEYRPRHEIRPFRLHLVHIPAFVLPVDVRRGRQVFPFELIWIAAAAEFAPVRCPACDAPAPLVATRGRLGCAACATAARPPAPAPAAKAVEPRSEGPARPSIDGGAERAPVRSSPPVEATPPPGRRSPERPGRDRQRIRSQGAPRARARPPAARAHTRGATLGDRERTGNKLALALWQCVTSGDRWPRAKAARDSPLRAVYRLYGTAGPQCAIGVPVGHHLDEVVASTYQTEAGAPELTVGSVTARGAIYEYAMSWWIQAGKPVVGEVIPAPHPLVVPSVRGADAELAWRLRERAPEPTVALDPVASILWRTELRQSGLPLTIRCLAAWWRVEDRVDPLSPHAAAAAAVASAVASAAGMRRTRAEAARIYATEIEALESAVGEFGAELRLGRERGW